jgi:hypothetical protein
MLITASTVDSRADARPPQHHGIGGQERPIVAPPVIPSTDTARPRRSASRRVIITILPSTSFDWQPCRPAD